MAEREKFLNGWFEKLAPKKEEEEIKKDKKEEETLGSKIKSFLSDPFGLAKKEEEKKETPLLSKIREEEKKEEGIKSSLSLVDAIKSIFNKDKEEEEISATTSLADRMAIETPMLATLSKNSKANESIRNSSVLESAGSALWTKEQISPELVLKESLVLSPVKLKDITAEVVNNQEKLSKKTETQGDNYYDIDINVEKLDNDYDVEQIADKIKRMIQDDAAFRNVQSVRFAR